MFKARLSFPDRPRPLTACWLICCLFAGSPARAVLFVDSDDPNFNSTAPVGGYEHSGWQYLGYYGSFLGTAIAPQYFITAQHFGFQGTSFIQDSLFTGGSSVSYSLDMTANGGVGFWDIAGSDLRVYKINETFSSFAELYLGDATGQEAVLTGRGGVRGDAILDGLGDTMGWEHTDSDGVARWGTNQITGTTGSGAGTLVTSAFDPSGGTAFEAGLSSGDSGGGLFVQEGGSWKLAGVNFSVDGLFDTNDTPGDGGEFSASLFDMRGFYVGSDGAGWNLVPPDLPDALPSNLYFSSVSANASAILAIVNVPEPGSLVLAGLAALLWTGRRSRHHSKRDDYDPTSQATARRRR
jgi:hypothetical protein